MKAEIFYKGEMYLRFPGNAPLTPSLHTIQDALHAAHKAGQKAPNGAAVASHKQNAAAPLSALHHQELYAPPQVPQLSKTSDESDKGKPGEFLSFLCSI